MAMTGESRLGFALVATLLIFAGFCFVLFAFAICLAAMKSFITLYRQIFYCPFLIRVQSHSHARSKLGNDIHGRHSSKRGFDLSIYESAWPDGFRRVLKSQQHAIMFESQCSTLYAPGCDVVVPGRLYNLPGPSRGDAWFGDTVWTHGNGLHIVVAFVSPFR